MWRRVSSALYTVAGFFVSCASSFVHQSSSASSRSVGAPIRPPAGPSVGLGTDTVFVTALYTAFGYSRFNRTSCAGESGVGASAGTRTSCTRRRRR